MSLDTSGRRLFRYDYFPRRSTLYEMADLGENDVFTCEGFDPTEDLDTAFCVNADTGVEIAVSINLNVIQVTESGLDDARAHLWVTGFRTPR